jgi:iron complex outermembrane receptor protein
VRSFLSGFLLAAAIASGGSETATLTGSVTDASGSAVGRAVIHLQQIGGAGLVAVQSNNEGEYSFPTLLAGDYLLDASGLGLSIENAIHVHLSPGEHRRITLQLAVSALRTQVSVTAAAEPQTFDSVSKDLNVVNVAETEGRGLFSVSQAVQFLPGIRVSTEGALPQFTEIQTRGLPPEDTAILIDGFRFRDPTGVKGDATAYVSELFLIDSSRIELLQGSGSSLYGTNAVGGTVNIITDPGGGMTHGTVDVQGGGLGLFRGLATVSGSTAADKLLYSAGLSRLNVANGVADAGAARDWSGQGSVLFTIMPGLRAGVDVLANKGYLQTSVVPQPTTSAAAGAVLPAIPVSGSQLALADQNQNFNAGNATYIPAVGDPDAGRYSHFTDSLFRIEQEITPRLSYRLGYAIVDGNRNQTDGPAGPEYQLAFNSSDRFVGRTDTVQARLNYVTGSNQVLTGGYEFERENYLEVATDQNPDLSQRIYTRTQARQQTQAAFAQDELQFLNRRLYVLFSGRYTRAELFEPKFTGGSSPYALASLPSPPSAYTGDASIAYLLHRSETKVRAHVGSSFRLPSLYERFGGYFYGGYQPLGDPRLSPERNLSLDGGFDQYAFHEHFKFSATYFYARRQNIINYADILPLNFVDPYGRVSGYYNTRGGLARGVETSAELRPTRQTSLFGSYSYTNAQDSQSEFYPGGPITVPRIYNNSFSIVASQRLPKHIDLAIDFRAGSDYLFPLFYGYAYRFVGPRQLGLSGGYTMGWTDRVSTRLYFRVWNALNQAYYEEGYPTPGVWAVAGLRLMF